MATDFRTTVASYGVLNPKGNKGAAYLGYVLLIMVTVAIATSIIIWSQSTTKELTESTVNLASGRLECKEVRIDATADAGCTIVTIYNKGTINLEDVRLTFDSERQSSSGLVPVQGNAQVVDESAPFANVLLLPIVKERDNLFGCSDKKLQVNCGT